MASTIADIDAALMRAMSVPEADRSDSWHAMVDALLEQRIRAGLKVRYQPTYATATIHASETR